MNKHPPTTSLLALPRMSYAPRIHKTKIKNQCPRHKIQSFSPKPNTPQFPSHYYIKTDPINQPQHDHSKKTQRNRKGRSSNVLPSEESVLARERGSRARKMKAREGERGEGGAGIAVRRVVQVWRGTCGVPWRRKRCERRRGKWG